MDKFKANLYGCCYVEFCLVSYFYRFWYYDPVNDKVSARTEDLNLDRIWAAKFCEENSVPFYVDTSVCGVRRGNVAAALRHGRNAEREINRVIATLPNEWRPHEAI